MIDEPGDRLRGVEDQLLPGGHASMVKNELRAPQGGPFTMTTRHAVGAPVTALSRTAQYASRAGSDAEASLDNLLTVLRDIIDFQTVLVSQIDTAKSKLRIHAVQNSDPALTVPAGLEIPLTASPCQHVAHSVAPFSAADMHADANLANLPAAKDMGATSYIGVPIVLADGSFFGTLVGLDTASKEQPAEYIAWMQILAQLAALQLQRRSAAQPA